MCAKSATSWSYSWMRLQYLAILLTITQAYEHDYVSELVTSFGYPIEVHKNIETKDGYLLTMHRIPYGKKTNAVGKPILLVPGFTGSSENFLWLGPSKSLGFLLADLGFDVWLGSVRSISYSRFHKEYDPDYGREYWSFSMTEMGMYDLPAKLDYILATTGYNKLHYLGFSQGVQLVAIMCSKLPEYATKIELMVALGPAIYLYNTPHPWLGLVLPFANLAHKTLSFLNINEILPKHIKTAVTAACHNRFIDRLCIEGLRTFIGVNNDQFNESYVPMMARNVPEGVSLKQIHHLYQTIQSEKFQEYDYGPNGNYLKYGQEIPPSFNTSKMTFPVALYSAKNDWFIRTENVERLATELPNVVDHYFVEPQTFCHFDFISANDIVPLLYDRVLKVILKYK